MVSPYSPDQSVSPCQRCGTPLFPQETRCRTCGYIQNVSQMPVGQSKFPNPSFYPSQPPAQSTFSPQQNTSEPKQSKGLLGRYGGASPSQDSGRSYQGQQERQGQQSMHDFPFAQAPQRPQVSLFEQGRQEQREPFMPSASQMPFANAPFSQGGTDNPWQAQSFAPQQPTSASFIQQAQPSWQEVQHKQQPAMNGNVTLSQQDQPVNSRRQRPKTGMIVGITCLLVVLIAGSTLGYLYFTRHTASGSSAVASTTHQVAATPTAPPLFSDNFTDNTHQWSLQSYPGQFSVSVQNNALTLESDNNKLLWELVPGNHMYSNFQLSVDATLSKGSQDNGFGIYFRSVLDQTGALSTYYRLELYGDGTFAFFKSGADANAAPTRLVDYAATPAIKKQGTVNHITILARGQTLQLSVNGYVLSTVTDTSYASGTIALFVSNLQNAPAGAQAQFSHLAIYPA